VPARTGRESRRAGDPFGEDDAVAGAAFAAQRLGYVSVPCTVRAAPVGQHATLRMRGNLAPEVLRHPAGCTGRHDAVCEPDLQRFGEVNAALARAAEELSTWLKTEALRGDQSHVLGPDRFAKLLRVEEGLNIPLEAFARMNEEDLGANKRAYETLSRTVRPEPVEESTLFATAGQMMEETRRFLVDHDIVPLTSQDAVIVRETPPYERWNSASIEMSGPVEQARSAFYQLTIPDKSWSAVDRAQYLGSRGDLLETTVHEVYPGHFVQGRWAEKAPTRVQRAFSATTFVEGWAHYGEEMMIDERLAGDDPRQRLAQLQEALLRAARYVVGIRMHTRGMTLAQAMDFFERQGLQSRKVAEMESKRGTEDPPYL